MRAVRSVAVVVVDVVGDESLELAAVPDDGPIQELAAKGADPSLREGVGHRHPHRGLEHLDVFGSEDLVEAGSELGCTVAHQRLAAGKGVGAGNCVVPGHAPFGVR